MFVDICNGDSCDNHGFLLIHSEEDPSWQTLVLSLAEKLRALGPLTIVDVSMRNFPNRMPPSGIIQKLFEFFGLRPVESSIEVLSRDYVVIKPNVNSGVVYTDEHGAESVDSALFTLLRTSWSGRLSLLRNTVASRLRRDYAFSYVATLRAIEESSACTVVVPNGRFPIQRGTLTAANSMTKKTLFYEKSWRTGYYHLKRFQTQDFFAQSDSIRNFSANCTSQNFDYAESWFTARIGDRNHLSEIGANFNPAKTQILASNFISLFTSSADEFEALGSLWPKPAWANQYEAFSTFLASQTLDIKVMLRVHPNSRNKPLSYALWEICQLRELKRLFPNLKVISPMSRVDSYDLALRSQAVYVWESTIGLEASYLGKKVYAFAPSMWAEACGAASILNPEDLSSGVAPPPGGEAARAGALTFIQGLSAYDYPVTKCSSWLNGRSFAYFVRNAFFLSGPLEWWLLIHQTLSNRLSRLAYRLLL